MIPPPELPVHILVPPPSRIRRFPVRAVPRVLALAGLLTTVSCGPAAPTAPPAPINVVEVSISGLTDALVQGRTTCRMVVQAHLDRIEAYDQPTGLNAISVVNPRALATADSIDAALAAGETPGPLVCAPLLVKDNFDTHDLPTTAGSIALEGNLPRDDAFMVRRIRDAGAVIVAKTNMAEWAFSPRQTVSSTHGTTANAYDLGRVPAGSSGGTASGVAASFGVAGLGSDTGNSIRGPSSHLALVGIRSTLGLTSRDGVIPLAFDRDVAGPMGRSVEDVARIFTVVAGYDPADPYTEAGRGRAESDYTTFLAEDGVRGTRLGVFGPYAARPDADTAITALFTAAVAELERLGAEIVEFDLPALEDHLARENFCSRFRYDVATYLTSLGDGAPIRDVVEVLETGAFGPDAERGLRSATSDAVDLHPRDADPPCPDFAEHPGRQAALAAVVAAMDLAAIDAFLFPTWSHPPASLDRGNEDYRGDNSQGLVPVTGLPAIMGFSYGTLPAGLQIVGRPYAEGLLFTLAYGFEQGTRHRRPPADFPPLVSGTR